MSGAGALCPRRRAELPALGLGLGLRAALVRCVRPCPCPAQRCPVAGAHGIAGCSHAGYLCLEGCVHCVAAAPYLCPLCSCMCTLELRVHSAQLCLAGCARCLASGVCTLCSCICTLYSCALAGRAQCLAVAKGVCALAVWALYSGVCTVPSCA